MPEKRNVWLPVVLMIVFAITRWPGLMPPNFSAAYALVFCAGVFVRNRAGWWVPLVIMAITDLSLNLFYYRVAPQWYQLGGYVAYFLIIGLGRKHQPSQSILRLVSGGVLSALLFYFITNTISWLLNPFNAPEYTKNLAGWLNALISGTGAGTWPQTWEFFRNTLLSAGLFTALFASAMKCSQHLESAEEKKAANAAADSESSEDEPQPEESKA
jgi:hypothetical protein